MNVLDDVSDQEMINYLKRKGHHIISNETPMGTITLHGVGNFQISQLDITKNISVNVTYRLLDKPVRLHIIAEEVLSI